MRPLGIAHLSALSLTPPELIHEASALGLDFVGLRLQQVTPDSAGYPLMQQPAMLRQTLDALRTTGLRVEDVEFIQFTPEFSAQAWEPLLDTAAELGARSVITAPYDPDFNRFSANLSELIALCSQRHLRVLLEFFPWTVVPSLESAWNLLEPISGAAILIDSLHFDRSNSSLTTLNRIPVERLPVIQLADAPCHPPYSDIELLHTARDARLPLGAGAIPLRELLRCLPENTPVSLEIPRTERSREIGIHATLRETVACSRAYLTHEFDPFTSGHIPCSRLD